MNKLKNNSLHFIIIIVLIFTQCTEPFEVETNDYENLLVVQGIITNELGPYKVVLSKTIPLNDNKLTYESNAIVTITDNIGNTETLYEDKPGIYLTNEGFKGEIGNQYQLKIETSDNTVYESEPVSLFQGIDIERTYTEYKEMYDFELNKNIAGVDFKLDTKTWDKNANEDIFLKWDFEEIWEIEQKWNELEIIPGKDWNSYDWNFAQESCWSYEHSYDILLDKASNYSSNQIKGKLINYMDENNTKPFFGYSILIKQYTINESAYRFWEMMKENNIENGELFDNIPYNATSNIECSDGNKKVFGYFDACYLSQTRLFLKSPINDVEFSNVNDACKILSSIPYYYINGRLRSNARIIYINVEMGELYFTYQDWCVDCEVLSAVREEPDYWIY